LRRVALAARQGGEVLAHDTGGLGGLVDVGGHRRSSSFQLGRELYA
jgi:hypothetical protein